MNFTQQNTNEKATDISLLIDGYPGPALICNADGCVLQVNSFAASIFTIRKEHGPDQIIEVLGQEVAGIASAQEPLHWAVSIGGTGENPANMRSFNLVGMPDGLGSGHAVMVLAMETTAQTSLRNALIDSREFFRDLADCAGDFVWATDDTGKFSYISPAGIGDMTAVDFHGSRAVEMFQSSGIDAAKLFSATEIVKDFELSIAVGIKKFHFSFYAEPSYDKAGNWSGALGVGRDVTELRLKEAELERIRRCDILVNRVLQAIRGEADPQAMLMSAAHAVARVSTLEACWIVHRKNGEQFSVRNATILKAAHEQDDMNQTLEEADIISRLEGLHAGEKPEGSEWSTGQYHIIAAPASNGGQLFGYVCFIIPNALKDHNPDQYQEHLSISRALALHITDQIAAAIALAEQHEHLRLLSRTDGLTHLLNRRAFSEEVDSRLSHHKRTGRTAALLYIDLDNFKAVNDTRGHAIGDEVLRTMGQVIRSRTRLSDVGARLGGDEFAIWLEEADAISAEIKANDLIEQCELLSEPLTSAKSQSWQRDGAGDVNGQIGMSIGIAIYNPDMSETLEGLLNRADLALYQAKEDAKHGFRMAPPFGYESQQTHQGL